MINKFPGRCGTCDTRVEAGAGQAVNVAGRWRTYHDGCAPARAAQPTRTPPPVGSHPGWHDLPVVGFDLEGTLPEPMQTRIVSAALTYPDGSQDTWLIDPGVPIPPDATARHGITNEMVWDAGRSPSTALALLGAAINKLIADTIPLVAFCAPYDVTALHTELARHHLPPVDWERAIVVDPSVLHREVEPRWFGRRQLGDLCAYYEVPLTRAHEAAADARAAAGLARSIAARHERIARLSLPELHRAQRDWYAEQGRELQAYFDLRGRDERVCLQWPLETEQRH
jgi:DNA polymerase-3 subunit epsilon